MRSLKEDLPFDGWIAHREGVRGGVDVFIHADPLNFLHFLQLILVLVIFSFLFPELVIGKRD